MAVVTAERPAMAEPGGAEHLLIVGLNYYPEATGNAPYTTGLAEHLASRGHRVTMVTGMPYYPQWAVLESYRGKMHHRETIGGVDVVRYRQFVPGKQSAIQRALFEGTFLLNGLRSLRLPRPDSILGIVPSLGGGVLAGLASKRYGVPYGLLFQDLVGQAAAQSGIAGGGRVAKATASIEARLARKASSIAVVSEGFRDSLTAMGVANERIVHVPNWSHTKRPVLPRSLVRERLGWGADEQIVLHAGNMGLKQGLEQVVAAANVAAARHPSLKFVLMGNGNQRAQLERMASGMPNVTFLDPQPDDWFADVLHAADALLVTQRSTVTDMSLPSKLTSYFVAGRPVVAAVSESSATATVLRESGAGMVVPAEEPQALVAALQQLSNDQGMQETLASAGRSYADQHLMPEAALARAEHFISSLPRANRRTSTVLPGRTA